MTYLVSALRLGFAGTLTLGLASACGGSSFSGMDDPSAGRGGSSSHAGSSSAGKPHAGGSSTAGTTGEAGENTGGTSYGGSNQPGGAPSGGSGGTLPGVGPCNAPPESGMCAAYLRRWNHDPSTGLCKPFVYGGCDGNANNYQTLEACQKACPGGAPNYDACTQPSECTLGALGCCGICDSEGLTEHDFIAYNAKNQDAVYEQCALVDIACAPCADPGPYAGSMKYFVPTCELGQCVVKDIRKTAATVCETEADCHLRSGNGCCPSCVADDVISVNNTGSFEKLVCGNQLPPCAACEPQEPAAIATCDAGRCSVVYAVPVGTPNAP